MKRKRLIYSPDEIPLVVDVAFICDLFQVSDRTVLNLISRGEIKAQKIGVQWRIPKAEVCRLCGLE